MAELLVKAVNSDTEKEFMPSIVYMISIHNLFKAFVKIREIIDPQINYFSLPEMEKIEEDLGFNPEIKELNTIDEICILLRDII